MRPFNSEPTKCAHYVGIYENLKELEIVNVDRFVLFNCSDRVVRVYNSEQIVSTGKDGEVEPIQKLQDLVNR